MTHSASDGVGFHSGELTVQRRAGVQALAARLGRMMGPAELRGGSDAFISSATFAAITARDRWGRLWTSPMIGSPGFLRAASPGELHVRTLMPMADPLNALPADQPVGLIVIDFVARRRLRINGYLTAANADGLTVAVEQAYGNCPQYIHPHRVAVDSPSIDSPPVHTGTALVPKEVSIVESADTFFLGTSHPSSGNDASHRGGPAGFVRLTPAGLWWPDYPGNNMFNSFGNLAVDPTASLLFVDFPSGDALHMSGTAAVRWDRPTGDDDATGRRVEFTIERVVTEKRIL